MTPAEAIALQRELAQRVDVSGTIRPQDVRLVGGVDVSSSPDDPLLTAGVVVLDAVTLEVVDAVHARLAPPMPYVPGLLSFREIPVLIEAFRRLETTPDVVLVDGQGIAHPRRLGIAAHLGLVLNHPTVGVAKSRLCGESTAPDLAKGSVSPLLHRGEEIGRVVRTKQKASPVFVSPGHRVDMAGAVALAVHFARGYRLPEPTRKAHLYVNEVRKAAGAPALL